MTSRLLSVTQAPIDCPNTVGGLHRVPYRRQRVVSPDFGQRAGVTLAIHAEKKIAGCTARQDHNARKGTGTLQCIAVCPETTNTVLSSPPASSGTRIAWTARQLAHSPLQYWKHRTPDGAGMGSASGKSVRPNVKLSCDQSLLHPGPKHLMTQHHKACQTAQAQRSSV